MISKTVINYCDEIIKNLIKSDKIEGFYFFSISEQPIQSNQRHLFA